MKTNMYLYNSYNFRHTFFLCDLFFLSLLVLYNNYSVCVFVAYILGKRIVGLRNKWGGFVSSLSILVCMSGHNSTDCAPPGITLPKTSSHGLIGSLISCKERITFTRSK